MWNGWKSEASYEDVEPILLMHRMSDFKRFWPLALAGRALAVSVLIASGGATAQSALPTLGDGADLTTSAERRLGDRIIRELYRDPDYIDDAVLAEYVQSIWQPLKAAAKARGELSEELEERFAWQILLGRDRSVNAFALPGGYLGVHLGLIGVVGTRDELASVMAHELSHVTQRHISRLLTQQSRQTPLLLGAMVLGALAASKNPGATQALVVGGQALAIQHKWGQTPINLSALHNQIGVTGPKFGKDGAFRSITAVACDGPCMLQCYM